MPAPPARGGDIVLERLLTVSEVADLLRLSVRQVRRLIASGDILIVRIGSVVRVQPAALAALISLASHPTTGAAGR